MASRLLNKIKGSKSDQGNLKDQKKERGEPNDKKELEQWHKINEFCALPPRGQEAFFRFLRGNHYPEDKDIISIPFDAAGMTEDSRSFHFWVKCQDLDVTNIFKTYITCDEDLRLAKVSDTYSNLETIEGKASDVDKYITDLKEKLKPDLDQKFKVFKENLRTLYGNGENLK